MERWGGGARGYEGGRGVPRRRQADRQTDIEEGGRERWGGVKRGLSGCVFCPSQPAVFLTH